MLHMSRIPAHVRKNGSRQTLPHPQSFSRRAVTAEERELSQKLPEKETEILQNRVDSENENSQNKQEIQSLLRELITSREALEKKDGDMLELSNEFKGRLDEKNREIEQMRRFCNEHSSIYKSLQENSNLLQRSADAEARTIRERLTIAEQELEMCKDDLFRIQPVCQTSDASIIDDFELLSERLISWVDNETSAFEKANPNVDVGHLFSDSKDLDVVDFSIKYPSAGEYLCRHMVNRYFVEHFFGPNIQLFGIPAEYTHMRLLIEQGMATLKPPRDPQAVNIWRAETLSALAVTQVCTNLRKEETIQLTLNLFQSLSGSLPNLFGRAEATRGFHDHITVPAMNIVSKLQGLASEYRLDMASKDLLECRRFTRGDLKKIIAIDLETGKTLRPGSAVVEGREESIGSLVLHLEASLHRVNMGAGDTNLRRGTWLVRLDDSLGSQTPKEDRDKVLNVGGEIGQMRKGRWFW